MGKDISEIVFEYKGQNYTAVKTREERIPENVNWVIEGIGSYNGHLEIDRKTNYPHHRCLNKRFREGQTCYTCREIKHRKKVLNALEREIQARNIPIPPILFD